MTASGDITRCVVSSCQGVFNFSTTCPAALHCTRSSVLRRAGDGAAQLLQRLALVGAAAHGGVQAETLHVGAQVLFEARFSGYGALQTQHLLAGTRMRRPSRYPAFMRFAQCPGLLSQPAIAACGDHWSPAMLSPVMR